MVFTHGLITEATTGIALVADCSAAQAGNEICTSASAIHSCGAN